MSYQKRGGVLKHIKRLSQGYSLRRKQNNALLRRNSLINVAPSDFSEETTLADSTNDPPLRIKTHIRVINLVDVDTVTETFKVHLTVFHEWVAPQSESKDVLEEGCDRMDISWKPEWHPSFEIVGAMSPSISSEFYSIKDEDWYRVHWRCDIKTEITDSMDLEEVSTIFQRPATLTEFINIQLSTLQFPFDVEDLTIQYRLRHATHEANIVLFDQGSLPEEATQQFRRSSTNEFPGNCRPNGTRSAVAKPKKKVDQGAAFRHPARSLSLVDLSHANVTLPEYMLFSPAPFCWLAEDVEYFGRTCSTVSIQLNFERSYMFYLLNIITIEFALLCVSLFGWAKKSDEGGRMTFDLIVLLTAINFRTLVADKLPEIGYVTLMDQYILSAFFFKLAVFSFHAMQVWLPALASSDIDKIAALIYISSVLIVHLLFAQVVVQKRQSRRVEIISQCEAAQQNNTLFEANQKEAVPGTITMNPVGSGDAEEEKKEEGFGQKNKSPDTEMI
jgi:hypothetical protein